MNQKSDEDSSKKEKILRNRDYLEKPFPGWIRGDLEERFTTIYESFFWGEPDSVSGPGSTLEQTRSLIRELPRLFEELEIESLLDIPCGDFHWFRRLPLEGIEYIGADIVESLIVENRRRHGGPGRSFLKLDLTSDPLPEVDLIFCRDGLVHLCYEDIARARLNLVASGATWLLTTTFPNHGPAEDIPSGDWRPLNLEAPPLNWPAPEQVLLEQCPEPGYEDKALGLWSLSALAHP